MDLLAWPAAGAVLSAPRRAGLAAAVRYHTEHGHLRVPADYEDAYGYRLGQFITGQRTAYHQGSLAEDWIAELEDLGMVWDDSEAAWQGHMATVEAFHTEHGHLAIPSQEPGGQFLVDQRSLARKGRLAPSREAQLTALDPHWTLPHGPDWHRKYHLIKRHIEAGHDPATLRRDTVIDGVKAGSWLHRQFTTWHDLNSGQRDLLTSLGLTADQVPLKKTPRTTVTSGTRKRRSFEQTALLLRAFVERHGRPPGAREWIEADGESVMIGPWLCKTRTKQKAGQLPEDQGKLMDEILREDRSGTARDVSEEGPADISKIP